MKKLIVLAAVVALGATSAFAQKFGRLDYQGTLMLMPEMSGVQTEIQKVASDYDEHIQGIQVERNKKVDEVSKLPETASETQRQLKYREIQELEQRVQDYYQIAQEGIQKAQMDLVMPLKKKLDEAIKKVCKAQGIVVAFQTVPADSFPSEAVFIDTDTTIDINAAVRKELGIAADAVAPDASAAAALGQ